MTVKMNKFDFEDKFLTPEITQKLIDFWYKDGDMTEEEKGADYDKNYGSAVVLLREVLKRVST